VRISREIISPRTKKQARSISAASCAPSAFARSLFLSFFFLNAPFIARIRMLRERTRSACFANRRLVSLCALCYLIAIAASSYTRARTRICSARRACIRACNESNLRGDHITRPLNELTARSRNARVTLRAQWKQARSVWFTDAATINWAIAAAASTDCARCFDSIETLVRDHG